MPIYEYKCLKCGHLFELIRPFKVDEEKIFCPLCGDANTQKLISAFSCGGNSESLSSNSSSCSSTSSRFS